MICNNEPFEPPDRLINFSATYSLNGPYSATASFADVNCVDAIAARCVDLCGRPISITYDTTLLEECCNEEDTPQAVLNCYAVSPRWVNGLLLSYERDTVKGCTNVTISSYYEYLATKPINSDYFEGVFAGNAINAIATFYGGVPGTSFCINSISPNPVNGPVEGNSTLSEMALLAQAGCANLFIQVDGCLTVEGWKDHTDASEITIPQVIAAKPSSYTNQNTTAIRVRGGSRSQVSCGQQVLSNNSQGAGPVKKCHIAGVKSVCANFDLTGLTGDETDIKGAEVLSEFFGTQNQPKTDINKGSFKGGYKLKNGGQLPKNIQVCDNFLVTGSLQDVREQSQSFSRGNGASNGNFASFADYFQSIVKNQYPPPFFTGGSVYGGYFYKGTIRQPLYSETDEGLYTDQPSKIQQEVVAIPASISDCGISVEDITNKYVLCNEALFKIAVRRFQEIQLANNTWDVEIPYLPCIRLNQVVTFEVPQSSDTCPVETITGIVGGLNITHTETPHPCTTMKITVSDTQCLGQESYTSSNLIPMPCAGDGSAAINPWTASAIGQVNSGYASGGCLYIGNVGIGFGQVTYDHCQILQTSATAYVISFDYELLEGFGNFNFIGVGAPVVLGGTGNYTSVQPGTTVINQLIWSVTPATNISGQPLKYKIFNISLTKTVTA